MLNGDWDVGMLGCWDVGMLGCWDVGMLVVFTSHRMFLFTNSEFKGVPIGFNGFCSSFQRIAGYPDFHCSAQTNYVAQKPLRRGIAVGSLPLGG